MRCSTASTRSAREASLSPASTGTAPWITIGPPSSALVTTCTVAPWSFTPASSARACVCSPGKAGDEAFGEDAHEARAQDEVRREPRDRVAERGIERLPRRERLVVDDAR